MVPNRTEYNRQWRAEHPRSKEELAQERRTQYARHPERILARNKAQRLVPLQPCAVCGHEPAERHHDDYSKPLDVRFLCRTHHRETHNQEI